MLDITVQMFDFHIGNHEHGVWYDSDERDYQPEGYGIKMSILWVKMVTPVNKWGKNTWQGDEPDFVLRSPFMGRMPMTRFFLLELLSHL